MKELTKTDLNLITQLIMDEKRKLDNALASTIKGKVNPAFADEREKHILRLKSKIEKLDKLLAKLI